MKKTKLCFSLLGLGLFLTSCSLGTFDKAHSQYVRGRHAAAVENYDLYIRHTRNGADITIAEGERADAYFQLGRRAFELGRIDIAARFYYLSNSVEADREIDQCYYILGNEARGKGEVAKARQFFDLIANYLPSSEYMPEVLYIRIKDFIEIDNNSDAAWTDYMMLCDRFPGDEWIGRAQPLIDPYIARFIDRAVASKLTGGQEAALEKLFTLNQYPSSHRSRIFIEISDMYVQIAESYVAKREYIEAEKNFRAAVDYDPRRDVFVKDRLRQICRDFIDRGDELMAERRIDDAIRYYEHTFTIIPDYDVAITAIEKANRTKKAIADARAQYELGLESERKKSFSSALEHFREAQRLDPQHEYEQKVFYTTNMVLIEADAPGFARKIISEYNGGKIVREVAKIENQQRSVFGDDVNTPGWKYMVSVGNYKYEVRYDIITPDQSFYFVWLVNLQERTVFPLNKATEQITK